MDRTPWSSPSAINKNRDRTKGQNLDGLAVEYGGGNPLPPLPYDYLFEAFGPKAHSLII
jgi:hypothetical protein